MSYKEWRNRRGYTISVRIHHGSHSVVLVCDNAYNVVFKQSYEWHQEARALMDAVTLAALAHAKMVVRKAF